MGKEGQGQGQGDTITAYKNSSMLEEAIRTGNDGSFFGKCSHGVIAGSCSDLGQN